MTRPGYQQWRLRLRDFHAERAGAILRDAGYDDATIARVRSLIRKEALKTDADAQTLEDVVDLAGLHLRCRRCGLGGVVGTAVVTTLRADLLLTCHGDPS